MVQSSKTFRVFVSSTFSDMKEERNALQKEVFPKLRKLCMEHGFRFQAIDLRWGVSEEAGLDQQTMKICLEEIERSQRVSPKPNFIVLLGERYGWRPLPYEIPADEFEEILDKVPEKDKPFLSWKGDLLDDEQLKKREGWYCLDTNALDPVYCLKPRFVDYDKNDLDDVIKDAKDKEAADWYEKEERIKTLLLKAIEELKWPEKDHRRSKYEDSATEQELLKGVLEPPKDIPHPEEHVFCFFREIEDKGSITYNEDSVNFLDFNESKEIDELSAKKLELLKEEIRKKLPKKNIIAYQTSWNGNSVKTNHLDDLCRDVYLSLACTIMKQIEEYEEKDPLDLEIEAHKEFGKERCKFFIGREENRDKIKDYLETPNSKPMIIYGESGSGKSALMAKAIEDSSPDFYGMTEDDDLYNDGFIVRFIGVTPESSDLRSLLESLSRQITKIYDEYDSNIPSEYNELVQDFKERLNFATPEIPIFIFLDALDQLSDSENAHNLTWIPDELPENVYIILSTLKEPFQSYIENRLPDDNLDEVLKLDEGKELLESWLESAGRKLTDEQENEIICKFEVVGLPLYLKLAFEEAKLWKSYSTLPELKSDISGIIYFMFERLSRPENHGNILVSHSLGYLSAAKNGLTEDEILDILALDDNVFNLTKKYHNPSEDKLPVVLWSRLYFDLEPYLTERSADGTSLLAFYHRQLGKVANEEYLTKNVKKERHQLLAEYFYKQDLTFDKKGKKEYNIRKVSELPYQETYGECWEHLENTLCDLWFVEAKCAVGMTYDLIREYNLALDMHPDAQEEKQKRLEHEERVDKYVNDLIAYSKGEIDHLDIIPSVRPWTEDKIRKDKERIINNPGPLDIIKAFSQFVSSQSHALVKYGSKQGFCLQQAQNFADSIHVVETAKLINEKTEEKLILKDINWLPKYKSFSENLKILEGHNDRLSRVSITPDGKKAVSGSSDELCVWNLDTCELLKKIKINFYIDSVSITSDGKRAVSSSFHESCVWDLYTGNKLKTLEWPSYVHVSDVNADVEVAVGYSDYGVYVWDLETNEISKTLKRSNEFPLAVSITSDSKKLVNYVRNELCVWDLEKGNVLKTINCQRGINVLALNAEGNLAVCSLVNGDILYVLDLDAGELIKMLKGHNDSITAIAITPDGKFVVSGGSDKVLCVWDLEISGSKTNSCHTDEVLSLAIIPNGKKAVSGSYDGSLCVWDLETAKSKKLKCYTENDAVQAVDVSFDGKRAVSCGFSGSLCIWDLENEILLKKLKGHQREVMSVTITPDGRRAVSCGFDGTLRVWDLVTYKNIKTLKGHSCRNTGVMTILPDGEKVITELNYELCVWNLETGKLLKTLNGNNAKIDVVAITSDGKKVVGGSSWGEIILWDLEAGKLLNRIEGQKKRATAISITPDGKKAICGFEDGALIVLNLETGKHHQLFELHMETISTLVVTLDSKMVISGSYDGILCVWDLKTCKLVYFSKEKSQIEILKVLNEGSFLFGCGNGDVILSYLRNIHSEIPIITAKRMWLYAQRGSGFWDDCITSDCQLCGYRFKLPNKIINNIREVKKQYKNHNGWISDEAWNDPRLISECPECHQKIRFNPFVVDNSGKEKPKKSLWKFWK